MITWDQLKWERYWLPDGSGQARQPNASQEIHLSVRKTLRITRAQYANGTWSYGFHVKPLLGGWELVRVDTDVTVAACRLVEMQRDHMGPAEVAGGDRT